MKRTLLKSGTIAMIALMTIAISSPMAEAQISDKRIAGQDLYQTARLVSEAFNNAQSEGGVILASGQDFPDALSATTLSKKLNAPILLVNSSVNNSTDAINYIKKHVPFSSTIYIIGGTSIISSDFEATLNVSGYYNIKRLSGQDRFDTDMEVVNEIKVPEGTPVFIASGEDFPDALSISSFSGSMQYPILLVGRDTIPVRVENYIAKNKPTAIYIAGGTGVISQEVENKIKIIIKASALNTTIKRLAGRDRYDTAAIIASEFAAAPETIYLANGLNFSDALAGSALASKKGNPILLVDHKLATLPPGIETYLQHLHSEGTRPNINALGGTSVVPDNLLNQAKSILDGALSLTDEVAIQKAIAKVTLAVEKAENSKNKSNIDAAKKLVDALPEVTEKESFYTRLETVQIEINDKVVSTNKNTLVRNAVKKAENSKNQYDVNYAKTLVRQLSDDSIKNSLLGRLNVVQIFIHKIKEATEAVVKAEISQTESYVNHARILVAALPEGTDKYGLFRRLEKIET